MENAKQEIAKLVEKYNKLKTENKLRSLNEAQTINQFIEPLFSYLGWDIHNIHTENEVTPEEAVSKGRVDRAFRINAIPKFFLEAKSIKSDLDIESYARQAINYSWNKGVTYAVLTDFESIKVFNAQAQSRLLSDKLIFEIPCEDFISDFERLWLLSKKSFEENALDKYAEKYGKKIKKQTVNEKLFEDMKKARQILTESFGRWNKKKVDQEALDEGVQRILDRLIFIRVLEDRGLEPPMLKEIVHNWEKDRSNNKQLFPMLTSKFRELDKIYNSNLFVEHSCEKWEEYDEAVKKVILMFYGTDVGEYDFKQIPADILGGVYENYLGYIAQNPIKTEAEDKKEIKEKSRKKRKEQGIYYTPKFIVDYIVRNTLGEKLKEAKGMNDLKNIKVLDPACGSGSFLTRALEEINDKYKDFGYEGDQYAKTGIIQGNIYGVDLDPQATELAKLNLLLDTLERKEKLPNIENIKVGNSLISGSEKELKKYFGKNWRDKKPFNWEEQFPDVFFGCHSRGGGNPGFDVIIGNPPYIFARGGSFNEDEKKYYQDHYKLLQYQLNTFLLFIERGINLLKDGGYFGFIVPNNWLTINSFSTLREYLLKNTANLQIINNIDTIFAQASVDSCLLIFRRGRPTFVRLGEFRNGVLSSLSEFKPEDFYENNFVINIAKLKSGKNSQDLSKFKNCISLSDIAKVSTGLKAYQVGKGKPIQSEEIKKSRKFHSKEKTNQTYIPYLEGVDVKRYKKDWSGEYLSYGDWLAEPRKSVPFNGPRILVRQIPTQPPYCINGVFTNKEYLNDINSMVIFNPAKKYDLKYILGIINSRLLSYWFIHTFDKFQRKIFPQFKVNELAKFPIYQADKKQQKKITKLVDKTLDLNKQLKKIPENSDKWNSIKMEIEKIDKQIDQKVYELYGLTEEEIRIVEK